MNTVEEKLACVVLTFCHAGINVVKADEIARTMFHDLDNNCDDAYFVARIDRYINALQNAKVAFESKKIEDYLHDPLKEEFDETIAEAQAAGYTSLQTIEAMDYMEDCGDR